VAIPPSLEEKIEIEEPIVDETIIVSRGKKRRHTDETESSGDEKKSYDPMEHNFISVNFVLPNSAKQMNISFNGLTIRNEKGYRTSRTSYGVNKGNWYWEALIEGPPNDLPPTPILNNRNIKLPEPHWRIGWSTEKSDNQTPVGYDKDGYSYRDLDGYKVHVASPVPYGESYKIGDVIGFYIELPEVIGELPLKDGKKFIPGSKIIFYKNGLSQGAAFEDLYEGTYYPAVALFYNAQVTCNMGPNFKYQNINQGGFDYMPMSNAYSILWAELKSKINNNTV